MLTFRQAKQKTRDREIYNNSFCHTGSLSHREIANCETNATTKNYTEKNLHKTQKMSAHARVKYSFLPPTSRQRKYILNGDWFSLFRKLSTKLIVFIIAIAFVCVLFAAWRTTTISPARSTLQIYRALSSAHENFKWRRRTFDRKWLEQRILPTSKPQRTVIWVHSHYGSGSTLLATALRPPNDSMLMYGSKKNLHVYRKNKSRCVCREKTNLSISPTRKQFRAATHTAAAKQQKRVNSAV